MKLPYIKLLTENGRFVELPLIEVWLSPKICYLCLVDSGAEFCCFHGKVGEALGLDIKKGKIIKIRGVSGKEFSAYLHKIKIKIGRQDYETEVSFSYGLGTPFGVLGRERFFNLFKVCSIIPKEK